MLTLTATQSYTGQTLVSAGILKLWEPHRARPPVPGYAYWFDASKLRLYLTAKCHLVDELRLGGRRRRRCPAAAATCPPPTLPTHRNGPSRSVFRRGTPARRPAAPCNSRRTTTSARSSGSSRAELPADGHRQRRYNFHRAESGEAMAITHDRTVGANNASPNVTGGTTYVNGNLYTAPVNARTGIMPTAPTTATT